MKPGDLLGKKCVPCEGGVPVLSRQQASELLNRVGDWQLSGDGRSIETQFLMQDFMAAVDFMGEIARLAEAEDHHPDLHLTGYRKLKIVLSTHAIGGLSENDFILAAKINALPRKLKK